MCELLSPVGDFECLKAAVQNGADSVYLGASSFNARARATNFGFEELNNAINYAKSRNVKVHLTLNTLIKNDEFTDAVNLAIKAYNMGVDAIIIQDLGLATYLLKNYPMIPLHASTQMTCHNLDGVKQLEKLGFKRVVLARELSIDEIKYIKENTSCELEVFVHGALCISYSGQCLLSSMIGGRSGNRGLCAQPCRMQYSLFENDKEIDQGYLLSPKDNLGIMYLPELIKMEISSFKIEGRMKTPLYVATVTKIYRKYIDYVKDNINKETDILKNYIEKNIEIINPETGLSDKEELLQVFNRGGMSNAHFSPEGNRNLIYSKAPNNIGIHAGKIENLNLNKGHISFKSLVQFSVGDKVMINNNLYNISELMKGSQNIKASLPGEVITIGRMKGKLKSGDSISKIEDANLTKKFSPSFSENKEFKKIPLDCKLIIHKNENITLSISGLIGFSKGIEYTYTSNIIPEEATKVPITSKRIIEQISKTGNTEFKFEKIQIDVDNNLFINMKDLNQIRRDAIDEFRNIVLNKYKHSIDTITYIPINKENINQSSTCISILLNVFSLEYDYSKLTKVKRLYIPLKYFINSKYTNKIISLCEIFDVYIYLPSIMRDYIYKDFNFEEVSKYNIKGFVISNISELEKIKNKTNFDIVGNYTLNVYSNYAIHALKDLGISRVIISPEISANEIPEDVSNEVIVYGRIPVMTNQYCYLGHSTKCYKECSRKCSNGNKYYIKDKFGSMYRIIPDSTTTITTMYFDKSINLDISKNHISSYRFDFLDETIDEMNEIINKKM